MSASLRYACIALALLIFFGAGPLCAGWNKILQLPAGQEAGCGFFFDADHGMIGTGIRRATLDAPKIYLTSDGGLTWKAAATPTNGEGAITSIMMKDANTGYASIFSVGLNYSIWKTTDGGNSWSDHSGNNIGSATCIYATSSAIVETDWGITGGRSLDDGANFNQIFVDGQNNESNGIDFTDDLNGIITMGPNNNLRGMPLACWITNDGGGTWHSGGTLPESWGIYALKGTQTFCAMPEGTGGANPNTAFYKTVDQGGSWNIQSNFPAQQFTGHIAGVGNSIYVQSATGSGLFRSDDLGGSWKNVNGPSHTRDTRFVVTGCKGEVVYAFDASGGVWRASDGGDGTLQSSSGGKALTISPDSLTILDNCLLPVAHGYITIRNSNCTGYSIDSISFSPDSYGEFSLDTNKSPIIISSDGVGDIPIRFKTDSNVTRRTVLHIHGNYNGISFDTTIVVIASRVSITGPLLALANDSISISSICQPARGDINLANRNCDSLIIDSLSFLPDIYGEFSLDTLKTGLNILSNASLGIPILFQSDSDVTRNTVVHIHAHSISRSIDTTIIVRAQHSTTPGPLMSLAFDSIYLETRYCQPLKYMINLGNRNCNDLTIDTIVMNPQYSELIIDTIQNPAKLSLRKFSSGGVPIFFHTDSNLTRQTRVEIKAHSLDRTIDTTIILVAKHSTAPEPLLETPATAKIGDQVLIPVYLRPTLDSFTISHYSFHLSYDGDVLSPANPYNYEKNGTLSATGTVTIGTPETNGVLCTVDFPVPITEASNLTLPLIYLRMQVYLSRNLFSAVRLDTFSLSNTAPLPLCTIPETMFLVDPLCGDSIISAFMLNGTMPGFLSIRPNPNSGSVIEAEVLLREETGLSLEISDVRGNIVQKTLLGNHCGEGIQTLKIPTSDLPAGVYFIRLYPDRGNFFSTRIVISK